VKNTLGHRDGRCGRILGFFRSDFSAFGAPAPNALKSDGFVPFGANLTHFGAKPTIPAWSDDS